MKTTGIFPRTKAAILMGALLLLTATPVSAQESAGYKLNEHTLNAGGHPLDGTVLSSAGFRISLDAIGAAVSAHDLTSGSFRMDGCFVTTYAPPGEVTGLVFADEQTLQWDPERSVGVYNLYRDLMSNLSGLGYGDCEQQDLSGETASDADAIPVGDGYFYLVTAENRLAEEGTRGFRSDGTQRTGPACP